ncbi:MAG: flippase-like domain-containing protein [Anaerolineaceae bacterium]|nr:flippase-like domain-containing protein [Anaerolineaceae bacterium]
MKQKGSDTSIIRRLVPGLVFGFVVLVVLVLIGDLQKISASVLHFQWELFPLVLLLTLFNYILRFFKWHYYLKLIGAGIITWRESLRLFVAGFPLAVTPGKVGEALKGVWLKQKSDLPLAKGISVVAAERISDGLAVLFLSTIGVIAYPRYWPAFLFVLVGLLTVVILSQIRPAALWLLSLAEKIPLIKRIVPGLKEFYDGSFILFRPGSTLLAVLLGSFSWFGEGVGFFLILVGLGIPASTSLLATAVFVLSFSTIVGAVSALPGGLGAAEISIAGMLALTAGLDATTASAATLLIRMATLWFGVGLGLLTWAISPELFRKKVNDGQITES